MNEEHWMEVTEKEFYKNFPYWKAVFEMVNSNLKSEFPNGDCYCGSYESEMNEEANMRLFAFYYKLSPSEKA